MVLKNTRVAALLAALVMLLSVLSGCGSNFSAQGSVPGTSTAPGSLPDSLRITIIRPDSTPGKEPQVTLRVTSRVQQLYHTLLALPPLPQNIACTADLGPHYNLTFMRGTQTVTQALARRDGCHPVTITGEGQDRQTSQEFWGQLDQAILAATPTAEPQTLAIQRPVEGNKPVQTALISDAVTAQRLYRC